MPPDNALAGKVALDHGRQAAESALPSRAVWDKMGARVSICGRDRAKLDKSASSLRGEGIEVLAIRADVTRAEQISSLRSKDATRIGVRSTFL